MEKLLKAGHRNAVLLRPSLGRFLRSDSGRGLSPDAGSSQRVIVCSAHFSCSQPSPLLTLGPIRRYGNHRSRTIAPLLSRAVHRIVIDDVPAVELRLHRNCLVVQHARWPVDNMFISLPWLRDHCRCPRCYNHATSQRQMDIRDLKLDEQPLRFELDDAKENVHIVWSDGHESEYNLQWIWQNSAASATYRRQQREKLWTRNLWDGRISAEEGLKAVDYTSMMETEEGLRQHMKNFLTDGVAAVTGVEATMAATERVVRRVGPVQHTHFGGMWQVTSGGEMADTAYSNVALEPHTDNTYFTEPAAVQVFHCLNRGAVGGETLLVDGFCALHKLYSTDPDAYRILSSILCACEFRDPENDIHTIASDTTISHRAGSEPVPENLRQLRFNPYDRAPLRSLPLETVDAFYRAYQKLADLLLSDRYRRAMKLTPGTVVFIDNWRVLHGRAAFSGVRKMCGGYMRRSDVIGKARVLGLVV